MTEDREDPLRVSQDNLAPAMLDARLRKMIKIFPKPRGIEVRKDIFLGDTCLKVILPTNIILHQIL